jgi:hypothetical protein
MAKQKIREKDKQQSTKHFRETTDWAKQTQQKKKTELSMFYYH